MQNVNDNVNILNSCYISQLCADSMCGAELSELLHVSNPHNTISNRWLNAK